jgi:7,8-dihydroneopterin aldolase/epimerase/oxygenase
MQVISVEGIECYAYHGCLPEEAVIGGRYLVDIYVHGDFSAAFSSDKLEETVDYGMINDVVVKQMAIKSKLIEHVASRILQELKKNISRFEKIEVRVTKFNPPVDGNVEKTAFFISVTP